MTKNREIQPTKIPLNSSLDALSSSGRARCSASGNNEFLSNEILFSLGTEKLTSDAVPHVAIAKRKPKSRQDRRMSFMPDLRSTERKTCPAERSEIKLIALMLLTPTEKNKKIAPSINQRRTDVSSAKKFPPTHTPEGSKAALAQWCVDADAMLPEPLPDGEEMMGSLKKGAPGVTMGHLRLLAGLPLKGCPATPQSNAASN